MWVDKTVYFELRDALAAAVATRDTLIGHNRALETTNDWFRVRISQLEHERAVLMQNYMGIAVPVMSIEKEKPRTDPNIYQATPHFNDVGDDEAKRLGIEWNPLTGEVTYPESLTKQS